MFAVAAPPKAFAATFKMTRAPKGHAVHHAGIARAFELVGTCLKDRRVRRLGKVGLGERFEAVADFTGRLQCLVPGRRQRQADILGRPGMLFMSLAISGDSMQQTKDSGASTHCVSMTVQENGVTRSSRGIGTD